MNKIIAFGDLRMIHEIRTQRRLGEVYGLACILVRDGVPDGCYLSVMIETSQHDRASSRNYQIVL